MQNGLILLIIMFFTSQAMNGQRRMPDIYLNHVFIVLDSTTYKTLFEAAFIEQKIGDVKTTTTSTTDGAWSGKYLYGKNGYLEFFRSEALEGSATGDFGLGFMTFKSNDIFHIKNIWESAAPDTVELDTTTYVSSEIIKPWFYSINLFRADTSSLSAWIMENTPDDLMTAGFASSELNDRIDREHYVERSSRKKFTKYFDRIISIHLNVNKNDYEYLKRSFYGFGLRQRGNTFFNRYVRISCTIDPHPGIQLKYVEIGLSEFLINKMVRISDHLSLQIKGRSAIFIFE